jgi:hypothetical protein
MNLLDAYVVEVLTEPVYIDTYKDEGVTWWQIEVMKDCYGVIDKSTLTFKTKEEADSVKVGYHFLT